jgi:hypothetical protein
MTMALSEGWIGLIGALGGVALTGVITLITAILTQRWTLQSARVQQRHDLLAKRAELRRDAYARLLIAAEHVLIAYDAWKPPDPSLPALELIDAQYRDQPEPRDEYFAAYNHARLVAGESVAEALAAFDDSVDAWAAQFARQWSQKQGTMVDYTGFKASKVHAQNQLIAAIREEQRAEVVGEVAAGS